MKRISRKARCIIIPAVLILLNVHHGAARKTAMTDEGQHPSLGGPDAVENQMESDRADKDVLYESKLLKPCFEWQTELKKKYGFSFGGD